eukprot:3259333-Amphidinium_carterae.1
MKAVKYNLQREPNCIHDSNNIQQQERSEMSLCGSILIAVESGLGNKTELISYITCVPASGHV